MLTVLSFKGGKGYPPVSIPAELVLFGIRLLIKMLTVIKVR